MPEGKPKRKCDSGQGRGVWKMWICGLSALVVAVACSMPYLPPRPAPERADARIAASFGRTWDGVIDYFARASIPVKTIERASGFIVAERSSIAHDTDADVAFAVSLADCGEIRGLDKYSPGSATFNVIVRGDSTQATLRVTMDYVSFIDYTGLRLRRAVCVSKGTYEKLIEDFVRARAERK